MTHSNSNAFSARTTCVKQMRSKCQADSLYHQFWRQCSGIAIIVTSELVDRLNDLNVMVACRMSSSIFLEKRNTQVEYPFIHAIARNAIIVWTGFICIFSRGSGLPICQEILFGYILR